MPRKKKKLVVYTSFDKNTPHWQHCEKSVTAWCKRMGATLHNLPKAVGYQPQWVIFDAFIHSIKNKVDRAAWIDCDILIQDHAPDIFKELDGSFYFCQPDAPQRLHPRMRRHWQRFGIKNPRPYVVSALALWTPEHTGKIYQWFQINMHRFSKMDGDQELLTVGLQESETYSAYFPPPWHKMSKWNNKQTPFLHAAGKQKGKKLRKFQRIADANRKAAKDEKK